MGRIGYAEPYLQFICPGATFSGNSGDPRTPCRKVELHRFLFFASIVWPRNRTFVQFDSSSRWTNLSTIEAEAVRMGVVDTVIGPHVLTTERLERYSFGLAFNLEATVYYSKQLISTTTAADHFLSRSLHRLTKPVGSGMAALAVASFVLRSVALVCPRKYRLLLRLAQIGDALMQCLYSFTYAQNTKVEAISLDKKILPFSDVNDLVALVRRGDLRLAFPYPTHFLTRSVTHISRYVMENNLQLLLLVW